MNNTLLRLREYGEAVANAIRHPDEWVIVGDTRDELDAVITQLRQQSRTWFSKATEFEEQFGISVRIMDRLVHGDKGAKKQAREFLASVSPLYRDPKRERDVS